METPQMLPDDDNDDTRNGLSSYNNRHRFLGRIAINCNNSKKKELSSHSSNLKISPNEPKKVNRKSQKPFPTEQNEAKQIKKNEKHHDHHKNNVDNISFNTSIGSSMFEEMDSNIVFWNPLQTTNPGQFSSAEQKNPSTKNPPKMASTNVDPPTDTDQQVNVSTRTTNIENKMCVKDSNEVDSLNEEKKLLLSSWGIPEVVLKKYHSYGIKRMFQWQAECLLVGNVLAGHNLVYSAPTSAGKTMVAELLILKRVLETKKKAIVILPFVSVAHEKVRYLKSLYEEVGINVGGFLGNQSPPGGFKNVQVAVCTIEKGNNLVNRLIEGKELNQLGIIVVDELHMVGDSGRGYLLELLLTKVLFVLKSNSVETSKSNPQTELASIQIIGMSATLPNLPVVAKWLNAALYKTDFRPVPLHECVKINRSIYDSQMNKMRDINIEYSAKNDTDHVIPLCLETVSNGDGVLIFCPTKMWCEKLADTVAREFFNFLHKNGTANIRKNDPEYNFQTLPINKEAAFDVVEQLKKCPAGLDDILQKTIQCGVAFHHAGLTFDEREIVESAFRKGIIKVLIATSTLSSGVNLPARRVIIRTVMFHGKIINTRTYKQMVGRAGRKGVDIEGESILMCKPNEKQQASILLKSSLPAIGSTLLRYSQDRLSTSMKRAILEIIVSGAARKPADVYLYTKCTLLSACLEEKEEEKASSAGDLDPVKECIHFLEENEFIILKEMPKKENEQESEYCFFPTLLGSAVLSSGLSPDEGTYVFLELQRARRCFVLENELHVLYLITPIYCQDISANLDWCAFYNLWEQLSSDQKRVAELVGIEESFLVKAMRGRIPTKTEKQMRMLNIHKRFFTSLALLDLVQETPLIAVSKKYKCNKGQLQSLQQSAATFAGMVTTFCARLGWTLLEIILSQFQSRLSFGIQTELCDLVRISLLNGQYARMLFSAGYVSVASLAKADPDQLEHILRTGDSFQSDKKTEDETEWEAKERLANRHCISLRGMPGMTSHEAAVAIIEEARQTIEHGLGHMGLNWNEKESSSIGNSPTETFSSNKKNNSLHRHGSSFTKFLKIRSQKLHSHKVDGSSACNSNGSNNSSQVPFASQPKTVILSPPPGFGDKRLNCKLNCVSQIPESGSHEITPLSALDQKDKDSIAKTNSADVLLLENPDITNKHLKMPQLDRNNTIATTSKNFNPNGTPEMIRYENRPGFLQNRISANGEKSGENNIGEKQTLKGKKSREETLAIIVCEEKDRLASSPSLPKNSPHSKKDALSKDYQRSENSTSISSTDFVAAFNHTKFSPVQTPKSNTSTTLTPTLCNKAQQLFTTSTPNENEQLVLDKAKLVPPDCQVRTEDECHTPVNNSRHNLVQPLNVHSSSNRKIQPKQLISASPSSNISDGQNIERENQSIEEGKEMKKTIGTVFNQNYGNLSIAEEDLINMDVPAASDLDVNQESLMGSILTPECIKNGVKSNDSVVESSTISDVFADSFVLDTQMAELMDAKVLTVQGKPCSQFIPKEVDLGQNGVPPPSETSPVLFVENTECAEVVVAPIETVRNWSRNVSSDAHDFCPSDQILSKESALDNGARLLNGSVDTQEELLPASNYERFSYRAENNLQSSFADENDLFNSYEDLRIPYESGQEQEAMAEAVLMLQDNTKQKQLEETKNNEETKSKIDLNLNLSNDDLFTPLPLDMGLSMLERQSKDNNTPNEFLKPMSPNGIRSLTSTEVESDLTERDAECANTKQRMQRNENLDNFVKIQEKYLFQDDSSVFSPSGSRKRKHAFSCAKEKKSEVKAKKAALTSKERDSFPSIEQNLSEGSDCFPPTPPTNNSFSESLQLSPITTPQLFNSKNNDLLLKKPSQRRKSSNFKNNSPVSSFSKPLISEKHRTINKNLNPTKKYQTKKKSPTTCLENAKSRGTENSLDPAILVKEMAPIPSTSTCNQVSEQDKDVGVGKLCLPQILDSDEEMDGCELLNESKPIQPLCDSSQHCSQNEFTIIDVCSNQQLFNTFIAEWNEQKKFALSIGCEKLPPSNPTLGIGGNFMAAVQENGVDADGLRVEEDNLLVVGMAICWNYQDSYYLSFRETNSTNELEDSLAPPTLDSQICLTDRLTAVRQTLTSHNDDKRTIVSFDVKSMYQVLSKIISAAPRNNFEDPKIAAWILDPGAKENSFQRLIYDYLPTEQHLLEGLGGGIGLSSLGLTVDNRGSGRYRATAESVLVWHLMKHLEESLRKEGIFQTFQEIEMPVVCTVSRMELNGIGFSEEECEHLKILMQSKLSSLEERAYTLAGHPFSLSSIDDVSRVLYLELQLPLNGNPNAVPRKTLGTKRGPKVHFSTSKETLEKLKSFHPLPGIILEWRRITNSLTKVVYPLQKAKVYFPPMKMHRIFGVCQLHTSTGRISMFDPNLQNIPKDFDILMNDICLEALNLPLQKLTNVSSNSFTVSMRHAFIPFTDGILIAADYSQLELRMIAHLSGDNKLIHILNQDADVFRLIAAEWKNVSLHEVLDEERQQAKQICYGIIYGIGAKALGETLHVDENDAAVFIETFKSKYPGMKSYLRYLVNYCREKGYIKTIAGRKRYLPNISSTNTYAKAQAERQAVNSTIQGSAADLVKKAMVDIEKEFLKVFPNFSQPHRIYGQTFQNKANQDRNFQPRNDCFFSFSSQDVNSSRFGAFLLLQIHDELLYEVAKQNLDIAARIIQKGMENAMKLSVRMPVKLKSGHSWGQLKDFVLQ